MKYKKKMKPKWNNILVIQETLGKKLKDNDKSYIDSVKMVAGELLENSVKYYMKKGIKKPIEFNFSNNSGLVISINNQIIEKEDITPIVELIQKVEQSINPYDLFVERLQEILDNRIKGESKLGLLRIASDGGFALDYTYEKDKLAIIATRDINCEETGMKSLEYEDLSIEVTQLDKQVKVAWVGKCRTLNPETVLDNYLAKLSMSVKGKKVLVTFDQLEAMNSSTVPPLLTFIKTLEENNTESVFLYDDSEDWQRASFKPLSVISGRYKNVKIKAISAQE